MLSNHVTPKLFGAGLAALFLGCGAQVKVDATVKDADGKALKAAFFATALRENQPGLVNEDIDEDGRLDVDEDLDADGVLDDGEDADGDGTLDFAEDLNGNGQLDLITIDLNRDGVIDENDNATQSIFLVVASGGAIDCADFQAALFDEGALEDDTLLFMTAAQISQGPNIADIFVEGGAITAKEEETDFVAIQTIFGNIKDNDFDENFGEDDEKNTLNIDALGETLDATLTATLVDDEAAESPLNATFKGIERCQALSDELQRHLDNGIELELF
jgi:hypothetical protein